MKNMYTLEQLRTTKSLLRVMDSNKEYWLDQYHRTGDEEALRTYGYIDGQLIGAEQALTMLGFYVYKDCNGEYQLKEYDKTYE
jgi:hypothetical protein